MTGFFLTLLTWNEPGRLAQRAFISCQQAPADGPTQQVQGWIGTRYTTLVCNQPSSFSFFKLTNPKLRDENSSEILKRKQTNKNSPWEKSGFFISDCCPLCFREGLFLCVSALFASLPLISTVLQLLSLSAAACGVQDFTTATCGVWDLFSYPLIL